MRLTIKFEQTMMNIVLFIFIGMTFFRERLPRAYYLIAAAVLIMYSIGVLLRNRKIKLDKIIKWQAIFCLMTVFSLLPFYIFYQTADFSHVYTALTTGVLMIAFSIALTRQNTSHLLSKVDQAMSLIFLTGMIYILVMLITLRGSWGITRLGNYAAGGGDWGKATVVALNVVVIQICAIYKFLTCEKKVLKILYIASILVLCLAGFLTGSRKSVISITIFMAVYMLFRSGNRPKRIIKYLVIGIVLFIILWQVVMNVPLFYDQIGYRIEDFVNSIFNSEYVSTTNVGSSDESRGNMIIEGLKAFFLNPLIGSGLGSTPYLYQSKGMAFVYSHNNFVEMLVSGGMLMFIAYYWFEFMTLKMLVKEYKRNPGDRDCSFFITVIISLLVLDMTDITYHIVKIPMLIILAYLFCLGRANAYKVENSNKQVVLETNRAQTNAGMKLQ